jgi:hypothetical protein
MTESLCPYPGDRDEMLVSVLYDEGGPRSADRVAFDAHLAACPACRDELETLRGVRTQLARWSPPEPQLDRQSAFNQRSGINNQQSPAWWRSVPAWAQVAAALLFLGVSAGLANLDVHYDRNGLTIRTGWSSKPPATAVATTTAAGVRAEADAPWKADLTALEQQLRAEVRAARATGSPTAAPVPASASRTADADVVRRVRAMVDESEKRQQRELALRIAEVLRDVGAQRQADLMKVDRALGTVKNDLGVEVLRTRQQVNLMYRASQSR